MTLRRGDLVRLTGSMWHTIEWLGRDVIVTIADVNERGSGAFYDTLDHRLYVIPDDPHWSGEVIATKRPVWVLSSHTPESGGGFYWRFAETDGNRDHMLKEWDKEVSYGYNHVTLSELHVTASPNPSGQERQAITELIDTHLLDLIEQRQIGRIVKTHDRWGRRPGFDQIVCPCGDTYKDHNDRGYCVGCEAECPHFPSHS